MAVIQKNEKDFYPLVESMFEKEGNQPINEFPINVQTITKRVDVCSAKWLSDSQFETAAVECKLGDNWSAVGDGLNQALAYQIVFPKVYVAAQTPKHKLGHLNQILPTLGIGYIQFTHKEAKIVLEPGENQLFNKEQHNLQVLNKLGRYIACLELWGKERTNKGWGEKGKSFWIGGRMIHKCNLLYQFHDNRLVSGVNFESTEHLKRLFANTTPLELLDVLQTLPRDAYLSIYDFSLDKRRRKSRASTTSQKYRFLLDSLKLTDLNTIFEHARANNYYIWFLVTKEHEYKMGHKTPTRSDLTLEITTLENEFGPLYNFIITHITRQKGKHNELITL